MSEQDPGTEPAAGVPADESTTTTPVVDPVRDAPNAEEQRAEADRQREADQARADLDAVRGELSERDRTLEELRHTVLVRDVADDTGIPRDLLKGSNREELEAHAQSLREWADAVVKAGAPRVSLPKRPAQTPFATYESGKSGKSVAAQAVSLLHGGGN